MEGGELKALAREAYLAEMADHHSYRAIAARARDPETRRLLERIAAMERGHARFWEGVLEEAGEAPPPFPGLPWRRRLVVGLARWLSPALLVSLLELGEGSAAEGYGRLWRSGRLPPARAERLRRIIQDELEHEALFRQESRRLGLGHVRDLVLGMNDGLVEILGAVTGLSAAYPGQPRLVALSGLVVGLAGALSMAIGAWLSVRSQGQVEEGERRRLELLFAVAPERAVRAYRERLEEAGVPAAAAEEVARRMAEEPEGLRRLRLGEEGGGGEALRSGLLTGAAYLV
ncbi:MAG: rubrerythrin family protein, partial [Gammaproteobacteria bacterium]